jgi:hypothetical protein
VLMPRTIGGCVALIAIGAFCAYGLYLLPPGDFVFFLAVAPLVGVILGVMSAMKLVMLLFSDSTA